MSEATRLLEAMGHGDPHAPSALLPLIYDELRRLARSHMVNERPGHTLQATALVHEAYVRLVDGQPSKWDGRRHFFAAAAEAMRRILIEHARRKAALKRGGGGERVGLDGDDEDRALPGIATPCDQVDDLVELDEALTRLSAEDPEVAELVKLHFFAGLTLEEAAGAVGISRATAYRRWAFARAWLHDALSGRNRRGSADG